MTWTLWRLVASSDPNRTTASWPTFVVAAGETGSSKRHRFTISINPATDLAVDSTDVQRLDSMFPGLLQKVEQRILAISME